MFRRVITHPPAVFGLTWFAQLVSSLGSALAGFSVMVHVYRSSDSITEYSLASFFSFLPMVLIAPVAGALVDRWDRRRIMVLADVGAGLTMLLMWLMLVADGAGLWSLRSWHLYLPIAVCAAAGTFRALAYSASTALMVPKQHLGRANGLIELALGIGQLGGPALAGLLVVRIGLQGVLLINLGSFFLSALVLLCVGFPQPEQSATARAARGSLLEQMAVGWGFIQARPGLLGLLTCIAVANLFVSLVTVLITPMVLSFADASTLGWIASCSGMGVLTGALLMSVWGGPRRRILGVLGFELLAGLALFAAALPADARLVAGAAFVFMFTTPGVMGCSQSIWQSKVPSELQGRVFAVRRMIALSTPPVAALLSGPLADRFFEPWMAPGGALAGRFGPMLGVGPGRGIALLYLVLGVLCAVNVLVAWLSPRVRNVELELPDVLREPPSSVGPQPAPTSA
ncbi:MULTISPECIES: MFS transporter [Myxococcus]|uniref:Multidrug efflux pump Tap n=1 Tax=Myxococcus llanfairpwllgwyngyllgogerychwyrndrobwllllantysiliogogogochensis TaxID=2590453 RepID=A0A540X8W8_9BACT|nr:MULTISPECIES: MFS transporter [Myxococcus]NTX06845.1 MFS transporter [Myxococcus sp. CA040A]NTX13846.1 MFS transporter [Myxococcus sp. CA056]TQF17746.1 MFS transporter [Myxococcus llanfairpwllgwyngyllgogerychwyrndrobwllllantysiliogogogochensis]